MAAQEQSFFLTTAILWEPSYIAYDKRTRRSAGPQCHSSEGNRRSGKDFYVCLKIIFLHYILTYIIFLHTVAYFTHRYILSIVVHLYLRGLLLSYP